MCAHVQRRMDAQQPQGSMEYAVVDTSKKKKRKDDKQQDVSTQLYTDKHSSLIKSTTMHACMHNYTMLLILCIYLMPLFCIGCARLKKALTVHESNLFYTVLLYICSNSYTHSIHSYISKVCLLDGLFVLSFIIIKFLKYICAYIPSYIAT